MYETRPDVFGDAENLPFVTRSANTVLMLDVLEHVPHPRKALSEGHPLPSKKRNTDPHRALSITRSMMRP